MEYGRLKFESFFDLFSQEDQWQFSRLQGELSCEYNYAYNNQQSYFKE